MTPPERRALAIICGTTLIWLTDSIHHLPPTIPALIGAIALFLPVVGVLTWKDFEEGSPWSIFLVIGSSLSLAAMLQASGAAAWLASTITEWIPLSDLPLIPIPSSLG
jgi:di/tricarboxylate transporter